MYNNNKNLYYLEELPDYKVASDYYDVREWDVLVAENQIVGKVTNLVVNKQEERVVYLVIEASTPLINDGDKHLIVPIGMVSLNIAQKQVILNQIDYITFAQAKRFKKGAAIDRDYELIMLRHYINDDSIGITSLDTKFYNRKEFENSLNRNEN